MWTEWDRLDAVPDHRRKPGMIGGLEWIRLQSSWDRVTKPCRPYYVYWHYDVDDRLLYVGSARDLLARARNHRFYSAWWPSVVRVEFESHLTHHAAIAHEYHEIKTANPLYNVAGSSDRDAARARLKTLVAKAST